MLDVKETHLTCTDKSNKQVRSCCLMGKYEQVHKDNTRIIIQASFILNSSCSSTTFLRFHVWGDSASRITPSSLSVLGKCLDYVTRFIHAGQEGSSHSRIYQLFIPDHFFICSWKYNIAYFKVHCAGFNHLNAQQSHSQTWLEVQKEQNSWGHVCERGQIALYTECVMLPCDTSQHCWVHKPQRKLLLAFTLLDY